MPPPSDRERLAEIGRLVQEYREAAKQEKAAWAEYDRAVPGPMSQREELRHWQERGRQYRAALKAKETALAALLAAGEEGAGEA